MKIARIAAIGISAACLSTAALAGCGSSDPAATTAADGANAEPRMSEAAYRTAANDICAKAQADAKALGTPTDAAAIATFIGKAADIASNSADALSGLYPPQALDAAHQKLVAAERQGVTALKDIAAKAQTATTAEKVAALQGDLNGGALAAATAGVKAASKDLGLTKCGSGSADASSDG